MNVASIILGIVYFVAMVAWVASEWMIIKETVRACRNAKMRRLAKVRSIATAVVDIPCTILSLFACFFLAMCIPTPNGYCIHLSVEWTDFLLIALWLLLAPVLGFVFGGLMGVAGFFVVLFEALSENGNDMFMECCCFTLISACSFTAAFMRSKIMWDAPERSKWRTAFVFWVTYWPHALLIVLLNLAEYAAGIRECCCLGM